MIDRAKDEKMRVHYSLERCPHLGYNSHFNTILTGLAFPLSSKEKQVSPMSLAAYQLFLFVAPKIQVRRGHVSEKSFSSR